MTFWDRAATLQIGPKLYDLSKLYFTFDVPFVDSEELNTAKITAHVALHLKCEKKISPLRSP